MKNAYFFITIFALAGFACRDNYEPSIGPSTVPALVVEANLVPGADSTLIRLTRATNVYDTAKTVGINNAQLTVEGADNTVRTLTGRGNGYYYSPGLNLIVGKEYRLRIRTADGREYLSDYVKSRQTPPIDSVSWEQEEKGVQLYVSSHDASASTIYYRWDFDETWEIRSHYYAELIFDRNLIEVRPRRIPDEDVSRCWKYGKSTQVVLGNSTRLREDIIHKAPLRFIPVNDELLSERYSMLVKQYALDKEAYFFFEQMKKNTEEIGSIFGTMPSELKGNIRSVNNNEEYVLGYVTSSTVPSLRKFISTSELSSWAFYQSCIDTAKISIFASRDQLWNFFSPGNVMVWRQAELGSPRPEPFYLAAAPECVDCRERNGSVTRPSYW